MNARRPGCAAVVAVGIFCHWIRAPISDGGGNHSQELRPPLRRSLDFIGIALLTARDDRMCSIFQTLIYHTPIESDCKTFPGYERTVLIVNKQFLVTRC